MNAALRAPPAPLRIALVSPLYESVPPQLYGGTERVVSYLAEELVRMGHDVTLYASGDSRTAARLVPVVPRGLRLDPGCVDPIAPHLEMVERVAEDAAAYDVVHFHLDYLHFPVARAMGPRALTTLHGRLDGHDARPLLARFHDLPWVSISDAQRGPCPGANWIGTVHHGLPPDLLRPGRGDGGYLAFLGRLSPEKRPDRAIRIARRLGMPIRIAAKIEKLDLAYFERELKPQLDAPGVEFVGEIDDRGKERFLGEAAALLFPIDWPEPFGLVMIEAMACGTPVLAWRRGSVPEILEEDASGWIVEDEDAAVAALRGGLSRFDRAACRRRFDERFTAARMAADYVELYRRAARPAFPVRSAA